MVGMNLYIGLIPWIALRKSRVRSWPRPLRWRQISAIPAAPAMIGMLMQAPSRCTLGKIGSSPTKVMVPPVSSGLSPRSFMTDRNCALMSKPAETFGVAKVSVLMWIPLRWLLRCDSATLTAPHRPGDVHETVVLRRDCYAQQRHPRAWSGAWKPSSARRSARIHWPDEHARNHPMAREAHHQGTGRCVLARTCFDPYGRIRHFQPHGRPWPVWGSHKSALGSVRPLAAASIIRRPPDRWKRSAHSTEPVSSLGSCAHRPPRPRAPAV